jgi:hypothetical protein
MFIEGDIIVKEKDKLSRPIEYLILSVEYENGKTYYHTPCATLEDNEQYVRISSKIVNH